MAVLQQEQEEAQSTSTNNNNNNNNNNKIDNRALRLAHIDEQVEKNNGIIISAIKTISDEEITVKERIQQNAFLLEEKFLLHDQAWIINEIGGIIYKTLKLRGLPDSKTVYVFDALLPFGDHYVKKKDHSSISSLGLANKHIEHLYKQNATEIKYYLHCIKERLTPDILQRSDAQDLVGDIIDLGEAKEKLLKLYNIPLITDKDTKKAFDGGSHKDEFQEKVTYPKTIPAVNIFTEELEGLGMDIIRQAQEAKREGMINPTTGKPMIPDKMFLRLTDAVRFERYKRFPSFDRKWKRSWFHWMEIADHAMTWFKHFSSTKFTKKDLKGFYRDLTREQIGAKIKPSLQFARKIYELTPLMFYWDSVWYEYVRLPRGAQQSNDLSAKLSDRSIK